jgi:hypothetical protein
LATGKKLTEPPAAQPKSQSKLSRGDKALVGGEN